MPEPVVVVGASGFVGRALVRALQDRAVPVQGFSSGQVDLLNPDSYTPLLEAISPQTRLVLVSALAPSRGRDRATFMKNLLMVDRLLEKLPQALGQLAYISSDAVYDERETLLREDSPCNPNTYHGMMHLARELMLAQWAQSAGVPWLCLRPTALFGPGDPHNGYGPNRFARQAQAGQPVGLFGGGEEQRDHLFIDDLAHLTAMALEKKLSGVLNLASGTAHSFAEVARTALRAAGRDQEPNTTARQNPITHRHFDINRLYQEFPALKFTSLEEGLARMATAS